MIIMSFRGGQKRSPIVMSSEEIRVGDKINGIDSYGDAIPARTVLA